MCSQASVNILAVFILDFMPTLFYKLGDSPPMEHSPWNLKFTELEPLGKPVRSSLPIPGKHCESNLFHAALVYANAVIPGVNLVSEISCLGFANWTSKCTPLSFVSAVFKLQTISLAQSWILKVSYLSGKQVNEWSWMNVFPLLILLKWIEMKTLLSSLPPKRHGLHLLTVSNNNAEPLVSFKILTNASEWLWLRDLRRGY